MIHYAWRSLWERKARASLTILGIAICVLTLAIVNGMLGSMQAERNLDAARFVDRLLLQPIGAGYPPFEGVLREESVHTIMERSDVVTDESTPLLLVVLEPPDNPMDIAGIVGMGILPGHERAWLVGIKIISGKATLSGAGDNAVLLGKNAARHYGVSSTGEVVTIAGTHWSVAGIFEEGSTTKLDTVDSIIIMPLASAQKAFGLEGWISAMLITAKPGKLETFASSLAMSFPSLKVNTQADIMAALLKEMEMPGRFLGTISWTAFVIAVLIIANIMIVAIRERAREVEPIRVIGKRGPIIISSALVEAFLLGLSGGVIGTVVSVPLAYILRWSWILTWQELLRVFGISLVAALVAGLYPAYRASRIYPKALQVDELRQQMELVAAEKRAIDQTYHQLVLGRERERERLARELHDETIQSLIGFKFRLAEKVQETQPELQDELNKVIASLRGICADLRPPALEALGLTAVLRSYAEEFSVRTGLIVEFMVEGEERRLSPEAEISLFRVVQEALTNAWKHAQAPKAVVSLNFKTEGVELVISDKGRGFALPERLGMMTERGHFGLVNMQERLALVGGKLQVTSMPEHGTTVTATVSFT